MTSMRCRRGDIVLVHAAAGGVGQLLCRWAKALGATVIGSDLQRRRRRSRRERVGCDHVDRLLARGFRRRGDAADRGRGAKWSMTRSARIRSKRSIRALAPRGHLVSFGQASGDVGAYSIDRLASRSVTLSRPNYGHYTDTAEKLKTQADRLFAALRSGVFVAERPRLYALTEARGAHADLEGRRTTGALVLIP